MKPTHTNPSPTRLSIDDGGLSTVEYVIILALIAVAGIGAWQTFGRSVFNQVRGSAGRIDKDLVPTPGSTPGSTQGRHE
jgi:Flp pilus assembly pilin Flp